jgi:O-methyltransferase
MELLTRIRRRQESQRKLARLLEIHQRYRPYTMLPRGTYLANLRVIDDNRDIPGCIVECGVWKGGMSASMAHLLGPERRYFLFDSFEGLPPADPRLDGDKAVEYQAQPDGPDYFDNCTASERWAAEAMRLSGARHYQLVKGWFDQTVPSFVPPEPIAILRLDGDWYDSTMICLRSLVPHLARNGIVILDDYGTWDGCSRAVHDYLSETKSLARIMRPHDVAVIDGAGGERRY